MAHIPAHHQTTRGRGPRVFQADAHNMPSPLSFPSLVLGAGIAVIAAGPAWAFDKAHAPWPRPPAASAPELVPSVPMPTAKLVDINRASRAELKTLPGIGDAEAAQVIAGRPYMTKTGLVEKNVLTLGAYDVLRSRIVVVHKRTAPKPKA